MLKETIGYMISEEHDCFDLKCKIKIIQEHWETKSKIFYVT
jgi:hypothetical protein